MPGKSNSLGVCDTMAAACLETVAGGSLQSRMRPARSAYSSARGCTRPKNALSLLCRLSRFRARPAGVFSYGAGTTEGGVAPEKSIFRMAHTWAYGMPKLMGTTSRYMWIVSSTSASTRISAMVRGSCFDAAWKKALPGPAMVQRVASVPWSFATGASATAEQLSGNSPSHLGTKFRWAARAGGPPSGTPINTISCPRDCSLRARAIIGLRWPVSGILIKPIFISSRSPFSGCLASGGSQLAAGSKGRRQTRPHEEKTREGENYSTYGQNLYLSQALSPLNLQALQVRNALRHQCRILLQFDKVVFDVSLPGRGEDFLPVHDALAQRHLFCLAVGGHHPVLAVHGNIAVRIAGEVIHRIEPVLHGGDLKLQFHRLRIQTLDLHVVNPLTLDAAYLKAFVVQHGNDARIMCLGGKGVEEIGDAVHVIHGWWNALTQGAEAEASRGHLGQAKLLGPSDPLLCMLEQLARIKVRAHAGKTVIVE